MTNIPRLELRNITKSYPSVVANQRVNLSVSPGEIHALLGENGAGKSTLMKIIYGVIQADAGEIFWNGKPVAISNPAQARRLGIGMVFQHFALFETLSVVENIALAVEAPFDLDALAERIESVSEHYGLPLNPGAMVHALSMGERQRVEIVRCLLQQPALLIMDEPTSVLTPRAVRGLFDTLRQLSDDGCSVLYISHKLDEIRALCHKATVMRGGRVTGSADPTRESAAGLARLMIGRELPVSERLAPSETGTTRLLVDGLSLTAGEPFGTDLDDIRINVRAGEIFGIAGISGNGQQELLGVLSGEKNLGWQQSLLLQIDGTRAGHLNAAGRRDLGLTFVPEDRLGRGAVASMPLSENALLTAHRQHMVRWGWILPAKVIAFAERCLEAFDVRSAGVHAEARSLSGGNLQKFIVGREILQKPRVLIAAQPTWGVDVGAAAVIHQALLNLRNQGAAILLISEDLEELFAICDRIAVIAGGRLSAGRPVANTDMEEIGLLMGGSAAHAEAGTTGA